MKTKVGMGGIISLLDPLDQKTVEVELPDGWRRVWKGVLLRGDKYLNFTLLRDGLTVWEDVTEVDFRPGRIPPECVIRRGADSPDKPCERCGCEPAKMGWRFCVECLPILIHEMRRPK